jgi:hypothetical protein
VHGDGHRLRQHEHEADGATELRTWPKSQPLTMYIKGHINCFQCLFSPIYFSRYDASGFVKHLKKHSGG